MKAVNIILIVLALVFSESIRAEQESVNYTCASGGREIYCMAERGKWQLMEKAVRTVATVNYDNGNVEIYIDDGSRGKRTLMLSPANLPCKINNYN